MPLLIKTSHLTVSDLLTDAEPWFASKHFSGTGRKWWAPRNIC